MVTGEFERRKRIQDSEYKKLQRVMHDIELNLRMQNEFLKEDEQNNSFENTNDSKM